MLEVRVWRDDALVDMHHYVCGRARVPVAAWERPVLLFAGHGGWLVLPAQGFEVAGQLLATCPCPVGDGTVCLVRGDLRVEARVVSRPEPVPRVSTAGFVSWLAVAIFGVLAGALTGATNAPPPEAYDLAPSCGWGCLSMRRPDPTQRGHREGVAGSDERVFYPLDVDWSGRDDPQRARMTDRGAPPMWPVVSWRLRPVDGPGAGVCGGPLAITMAQHPTDRRTWLVRVSVPMAHEPRHVAVHLRADADGWVRRGAEAVPVVGDLRAVCGQAEVMLAVTAASEADMTGLGRQLRVRVDRGPAFVPTIGSGTALLAAWRHLPEPD